MLRSILALTVLVLLVSPGVALANSNTDVINALTQGNVYVSPQIKGIGHVRPGDTNRLLAAVDAQEKHSVQAKVALLRTYPSNLRNPYDAADHLRNYIDFSGVLVLVSPKGIGVSSDFLSQAEVHRIGSSVQSQCGASYASCAIAAIRASAPRIRAEQSQANRNVAVFWGVSLVIFAAVIALLVFFARRQQTRVMARLEEERAARSATPPAKQKGKAGKDPGLLPPKGAGRG